MHVCISVLKSFLSPSCKRELAAMEVMGIMANCMLSQSGEYCPTLTPKGSIPHPNAQRGVSAPTGCGGRRLILAPYISWHVQVRWAGETPSRVDIYIYISTCNTWIWTCIHIYIYISTYLICRSTYIHVYRSIYLKERKRERGERLSMHVLQHVVQIL